MYLVDLKNDRPLSIIIPIVVFHDDKISIGRPLSSYFKFKSDLTNAFIPDFNYVFLNVKRETDEKLFKLTTYSGLRSLLLLFKHIKNRKFLIRNLLEILKVGTLNENNDDLISQFLLYLFSNSNLAKSNVEEILESQPEEAFKKIVMTTAQQWKKEGKIEGKMEEKIEVVRNGWLKGYTKHQISDFTKLPIKEIERLIAQFEKETKAN